jgi:hypothetical protein
LALTEKKIGCILGLKTEHSQFSVFRFGIASLVPRTAEVLWINGHDYFQSFTSMAVPSRSGLLTPQVAEKGVSAFSSVQDHWETNLGPVLWSARRTESEVAIRLARARRLFSDLWIVSHT